VDAVEQHFREVAERVRALAANEPFRELSRRWLVEATRSKYVYNFTWLGRPIIQLPQDVVAMQELIWRVRPRAVVETGVAHGGSLVLHASILELIGGDGIVVGVDVEVRPHNRREIERHFLAHRMRLIEGSSILPGVLARVRELVGDRTPVLVVLDSNHAHDHVLAELEGYAPLVTAGSYLVVFDTVIEELPDELFAGRPWRRGSNAMTAVEAFLGRTDRFEIDEAMHQKLLVTAAPRGFLRCLK
jgi:cephalosporin hydroxylase